MIPSTKPYLIRSIYDWCTDSNFTPYIIAKIISGVKVPKNHIKSNEIVLNLSLDSTNKLIFDNNFISFSARFEGKNQDIFLPIESIAGIYSKENGEGIFFEVDESMLGGKEKNKERKIKKSHLSLVK
jgi:stringent starvation protein B|tara:strand:+ start:139 stop:519 length:381 start_codon:yes stop_codon:yes gene_type:complete